MILLKRVLKEQHMTQTVLAERVGLAQTTVSGYCVGRNKPNKKNAYLIALALRYKGDPEDLFKEV